MSEIKIIDLTPENIADYGVCGYKDVSKHLELRRKIEWFKNYYPFGLRIKALITEKDEYQGMLEYIPGKYAHRPVDADGYMFIHCVFMGLKKEAKGKGYGSLLIESCIEDAKSQGMSGVAVVTRKGSFMAKNDIFLKKGFVSVDKAKPDFELLVLKFNESAKNPSFRKSLGKVSANYSEGLTILRSPQCPYSVKNVEEIIKTAKKLKLTPNLVELDTAEKAQENPSPFGTFGIILNGEIITHHPISNTRFENIIKGKE